jgi:hypothetical protein
LRSFHQQQKSEPLTLEAVTNNIDGIYKLQFPRLIRFPVAGCRHRRQLHSKKYVFDETAERDGGG